MAYSIKNFIPLLTIFLLIIAAVMIKAYVTHDSHTASLMYDFMGFFFLVFGSFKLLNLRKFAVAYAEYDIFAQKSMFYGYCYPFIELLLGVVYLLRVQLLAAHVFTLILMFVNALGIMRALRQERTFECACLGMVFSLPMTYVSLLEALMMAAMAWYMLVIHFWQ